MERKRRGPNGELEELTKIGSEETQADKITRLEESEAVIAYDSMVKDMRLERLEESQAELVYQLMQGGIV